MNRQVRRIIWLLAVGAVRYRGPYRDYFAGRTAAGKHKMDSLVAVGRKLLSTIYAILKTGRAYAPAYRGHQLTNEVANRLPAAAAALLVGGP